MLNKSKIKNILNRINFNHYNIIVFINKSNKAIIKKIKNLLKIMFLKNIYFIRNKFHLVNLNKELF